MTQAEESTTTASLKRFLADPLTIDHLLRCLAPFTQQSSQSKSTFDTKTSAVNVTQSSHARYDIKQLQEDSLWLSSETKIDEVSALRIAVLEWQTRPASQLRRGAQISHGHSTHLAQASDILEEGPRRRRLAELLLSDRRFILKCAEYILSYTLSASGEQHGDTQKSQPQTHLRWLVDVGLNVFSRWTPEQSSQSKGKQPERNSSFLIEAIAAIRSRLELLGSGSGWSASVTDPDLEISWGCNQVTEILHIMQLMQDLLQSTTTIVKADIVLPWFRLMGECEFLDAFQLVRYVSP